MYKLLMVCLGNICRSPMAQVVAQKLAVDAGLAQLLLFDSAGTHTPWTGERPDPRAVCALSSGGYFVGKVRSRKITPPDFQRFDLILAMDCQNLAYLKTLSPPEHQHKLHLFLSFAPELNTAEVPDPYYGSPQGFTQVLTLCEAGARGLIRHYTL